MRRLTPLITISTLLVGCAHDDVAPTPPVGAFQRIGREVETSGPIPGLEIYDSGFNQISSDGANIVYPFDIALKNWTVSEIKSVTFALTMVDQAGRELARSAENTATVFDNDRIPFEGSLMPMSKADVHEHLDFAIPRIRWQVPVQPRLVITKCVCYRGKQDLHDPGHLAKALFDLKPTEPNPFKMDPSLFRVVSTNGMDAGLFSIASGRVDVIEYVLAHGGKITAKTADGSNAMFVATGTGLPEVLEFIRSKGIPSDSRAKDGTTPLMKAVIGGLFPSVQWLIAHGADPNLSNVRGRTALILAMIMGQNVAMNFLVEHKANIHAHDKQGLGLMHYACRFPELLPDMVSMGLNVNDQANSKGMTPLDYCATRGLYDGAHWLLEHGASLEQKNGLGWSALDYAKSVNIEHTDLYFRQGLAASKG